ncbi:Aromatic amino acid aminotransferase C56E4.03 [Leucoagaricus sp. SymC.cos]|nr:Aromatic amino acid aminotransferase C56E4.03 [Leucoagaricus sp. SymC.cos]
MTLCDPGDNVLYAEWTYPSELAAADPLGIKAVPVPVDNESMRSDALFKLLTMWDENEHGGPRPRVMYTVPVGQNPTGAASLQWERDIYNACVKFNAMILEDDPLSPRGAPCNMTRSNDVFLNSLAPNYLRQNKSIDYQGHVVRSDSFSKTIVLGCRLGWFTCIPLFSERFERQRETLTQGPSGLSQVNPQLPPGLVAALLLNWRFDGYVRWLQGLRGQYRERRDLCVDLFAELQINFRNHTSFNRLGHQALESKICQEFAGAGVLVGPGFTFSPRSPEFVDDDGLGHIRLSFGNAVVSAVARLQETQLIDSIL